MILKIVCVYESLVGGGGGGGGWGECSRQQLTVSKLGRTSETAFEVLQNDCYLCWTVLKVEC